MIKTPCVSCIIPAYNEAKNIGRVLQVANSHPLIEEVIVVDDGSTDNTSKIVEQFKTVKLIRLKKNCGKAYAVKKGVESAISKYILLLDADLVNLRNFHITQLVKPVVINQMDITFSMRNFHKVFPLKIFINLCKIDPFTGERCFKREMFEALLIGKETPGYALEAIMNEYIIINKLKLLVLNFQDLKCIYKTQKKGLIGGIIGDLITLKQILKIIPGRRFFYHYYALIKMRKYVN